MRHLIIVLTAMLCVGCAQLPSDPVLPPPQKKAQAVVFDIDGTLTPDVLTIFEAREHAADAAQLFAKKGYKIFYLSTRAGFVSANIPGWLTSNRFPSGSVLVAQTDEERDFPDDYKARMLKKIISEEWDISYAYGDSYTDFLAYARAGIPKERVFALQRRYDPHCHRGEWNKCLKGWTEHLEFVRSVPPARTN
ncbi:MAG: HAD family acid phosphatase [Polaromonas sp.]|nr:HAD family acid phosphatase [Polaromonas sp.]